MEETFHFVFKYEDSESLFRLTHGKYNKKKIFALSVMTALTVLPPAHLIDLRSGCNRMHHKKV